MKHILQRLPAFLLLGAMMVACGDKSHDKAANEGDPDQPQNPGLTDPAGAPEESVNMLSDKDKESFENWKARISKSCSGGDIFMPEGADHGQKGVDLSVFSKALDGKHSLFSDDSFVLFGTPEITHSFEKSDFRRTVSVDGKTYTLEAQLKLTDGLCEVFLFGQKVHEFELARHVPIIAAFNTRDAASYAPIQHKSLFIQNPLFIGRHILRDHGFVRLVKSMLEPRETDLNSVAETLSLPTKEAIVLFPTAAMLPQISVRLTSPVTSTWFNESNVGTVAIDSDLYELFSKSETDAKLEVKIKLNQQDLKAPTYSLTTNVSGIVSLNLHAAIKPEGNDDATYTLKGAEYLGISAFDPMQSSQCLLDLATRYVPIATTERALVPSFETVAKTCGVLSVDFDKDIRTSGALVDAFDAVFAFARPSLTFAYNAWDAKLSGEILVLNQIGDKSGLDLLRASKSQLVLNTLKYHDRLAGGLQEYPALAEAKTSLLFTGMSWAFSGQEVSEDFIGGYLEGLGNTIVPFKVSTLKAIESGHRNAEALTEAVDFAQSIDSEFKALAVTVNALAMELEYIDWSRDYFDQMLQKRPSFGDLKSWESNLSAVKTRLSHFPQLNEFRGKLTNVLLSSLKRDEISSIDEEGFLSALANAIDPFKKATVALIEKMQSGIKPHQKALDYAASLTAPHKEMASKVFALASEARLEAWGEDFFATVYDKRPTPSQLTSWILTLSAAKEFVKRDFDRVLGIYSLGYLQNWQKVAEKALHEGWQDREFVLSERVSAFATKMAVCERYLDNVNLMECAGLDYFTNGENGALSPAFEGRYGKLSENLLVWMDTLEPKFDYLSVRGHIERGYFDFNGKVMWSGCSNEAFKVKMDSLGTMIGKLVETKEQFQKWKIEDEVRNIVKDCR